MTAVLMMALGLPLAVPPASWGAPEVKFKARAVPIPKPGGGTYAHTGNILGAPAAVQAEYKIIGTGYGATAQNPLGGAPPLSQVNFYLPAGVTLSARGFASCSRSTLERAGPAGCPRRSVASPKGSALGEVTFGAERVPESASLQAFFAPGGQGLLFYVAGHSPVSLEFISSGSYVPAHAHGYGLELKTLVPAIATVPGAALASTRTIDIRVGAAFRKRGRLVSYGRMPRRCPRGGFPVKTELVFGGLFGGDREFGIPAETVTKLYRAPCPRRRARHH